MVTHQITPHSCRLRDLTYSAPIYVDVEYYKGGRVEQKRKVAIGKLPIMLKSSKCVLHRKTNAQLAAAPGVSSRSGWILCRQGHGEGHPHSGAASQESNHSRK